MQGLIDTHFHLDMYKNYDELYQYIAKEKQYTLCMTNSPGVFLSCKKMYVNNKYINFALGFHPLNMDLKKKDFDDFLYLLPQTDYVGEIGLDFSKRSRMSRKQQVDCFDVIIKKCSEGNKLISVHVREAEQEAFDILSKYRPKRCILHWYTGTIEMQKKFLDIGCFFSINANMLKNMQIINSIPLDKLLIESDGPYSKVDGKRFTPQLLLREYELIAKAINEPDLMKKVYENFKRILLMGKN